VKREELLLYYCEANHTENNLFPEGEVVEKKIIVCVGVTISRGEATMSKEDTITCRDVECCGEHGESHRHQRSDCRSSYATNKITNLTRTFLVFLEVTFSGYFYPCFKKWFYQ